MISFHIFYLLITLRFSNVTSLHKLLLLSHKILLQLVCTPCFNRLLIKTKKILKVNFQKVQMITTLREVRFTLLLRRSKLTLQHIPHTAAHYFSESLSHCTVKLKKEGAGKHAPIVHHTKLYTSSNL